MAVDIHVWMLKAVIFLNLKKYQKVTCVQEQGVQTSDNWLAKISWEKPDAVANKSNKCSMAKLDDQTIGKAGIPPKNAGSSYLWYSLKC